MSLPIDPIAQYPDPLGADGSVAGFDLDDLPRSGSGSGRTTPAQYLRDVQAELRKVAWPTRKQLVNYSSVVLVTLVIIVSFIFGLNIGFQHVVQYLLQP
ncbi:MAG: preprotein translocase subunit SecE [Acidimicrobiales bacterium]